MDTGGLKANQFKLRVLDSPGLARRAKDTYRADEGQPLAAEG